MASTPKCFYRGNLPPQATPTTLTVPVGKRWIVTSLVVAGSAVSSSIANIALGTVAFLNNMPIKPNDTLAVEFMQVLEAGDTIVVYGGGTTATHISGVEQDVYQ